ncbi:pheophytinase, chloroplastic [Rutidosis leptorrhynchoides]|uniref:pheophytinase, chloroplastic n=1 Tax=Rutidosis leptorrhynchoides TaxID=125765 RepID=UPI003A9A3905
MEIINSHSAPCSQLVTSRQLFCEKGIISPPTKFSRRRKLKVHRGLVSLNVYKNTHKFMTINALKAVEGVIDVEENATNRRDTIPKVLIPGLPDNSKGDINAPVTTGQWEWKPNFNIHYERSGSRKIGSPQVLFLPGFGVGSFHYEKQLKDLGRDYGVWAMDFLGQGMSLPCEDPTQKQKDGESQIDDSFWGFGDQTEPWADNLVYSIDLWQEQVQYFIEEVIKEPVYIVGNSLGGYVALYFAACNPRLVKGVTLLNATPFWGIFPNPVRNPRLSQMFPSVGTFPLSPRVRKIMEIVWQKIRDPRSIGEILKQVYSDHSTNVDKVFTRILEITEHPAALASFASIMLAPQGKLSFGEALLRCKSHNTPICLMYGKEDPWVRPVWGQQVKKQLPQAPYYQISPAGHCPHDEVPEVVNFLLRGWIKNIESQGFVALPLLDDESGRFDVARDLEYVRDGTKRSVRVQFYGSESSVWTRMTSFLNNQLKDLTIKYM